VGLQEVKLAFLRRSIKKPRFWMRANTQIEKQEDILDYEKSLSESSEVLLDAFIERYGLQDSASTRFTKTLRQQFVDLRLSWKSAVSKIAEGIKDRHDIGTGTKDVWVDDESTIVGNTRVLKRHSSESTDPNEEFRSFSLIDKQSGMVVDQYMLSPCEAKVIQVLWGRFKSGTRKVRKTGLGEAFKPSKVFGSEGGARFRHQFIRGDNKGVYWLEVP
jgi:hypothetical protein